MRDHGVDRDDQIEPTERVRQPIDVRCTDVAHAGLSDLSGSHIALHGEGGDAWNQKGSNESRRHLAPLVPIADTPHQSNRQSVVIGKQDGRSPRGKIRPVHTDMFQINPQRMRELHDLDIDVEHGVRCSVMQGKHPTDTRDPTDQFAQRRLTPHDDLPRDPCERGKKPCELDGIAEPVIAAHQHDLVAEILALPDLLQVARSLVLGGTVRPDRGQIAIGDGPGSRQIAGPHRSDPVIPVRWLSRRSAHASRRTNLWKRLIFPSLVRS